MGSRLSRRPDRAPLVLGHRGYRARFPENTLLAFREAFRAGADGIEFDVQKSGDGRYVVIHDPSLDRASGHPGSVSSLPLAQLRRLDVGLGERIPTLAETLDALPSGAWIDVELKADTLAPEDCVPIARELSRVRRRRVMISSFDSRLLPPMRALGLTTALLLGEEARTLGPLRLALILLRIRPSWLNLPIQILSLRRRHRALLLVRLLKALGFSILFWTVNEESDARRVARVADCICTDEVETMVRLRAGRAAAARTH